MATPTKADWDALIARLNTVTSAWAAKLQAASDALAAALANAGIPADQEQASFTAIDDIVKAAEAMGSDPANPIPSGGGL